MYRLPLDTFDPIPAEMMNYLRHYGYHFNKKACEYAVKMMQKRNTSTNKLERIEPWSKDDVDELLKKYGITLENNVGHDYVYVANMAKSDYFKSSLPTEAEAALYIKDTIDDVDACDGAVFVKWYACMMHSGEMVEWDELL